VGFFRDLSSNLLSFSWISRSHHYGEACFGVLEGKTTPDFTSSWYHCNCASRQVQRCHHSSQNLLLPKPKPTRQQKPNQEKFKQKQSSSRDVGLLKLVLQNQSDFKYCSNTKQDFIAGTGGATTEVPCEASKQDIIAATVGATTEVPCEASRC
jgi:branched-subunit amino acid aminotransferase/4-amino-4-deoxychorismate lyase